MMRHLFLASLLIFCWPAHADTGGQVAQSIYNRGVYFDEVRFDTLVLVDFINDAQALIAAIGRTNQAETTIVVSSPQTYALPSDFYQVQTVLLNADPAAVADPRRTSLKYVPTEMFGRLFTVKTSRPTQYSIWADSLWVDVGSVTDEDTVFVFYFARPTELSDTSSTVDLPQQHIPLLKEIVRQMCLERIEYPAGAPEEKAFAIVKMIETALLGREAP